MQRTQEHWRMKEPSEWLKWSSFEVDQYVLDRVRAPPCVTPQFVMVKRKDSYQSDKIVYCMY